MAKMALKKKVAPPAKKTKPAVVGSFTSNVKTTFNKKELGELRKRDELVAQYMPYASSIASRVYQGLSSVVEYDEVVCNARLGLFEAAKRFDEAHGVDFKTFAYYRIKGAIYDGLRKAGWIPRTLYAKIKFEEAANDYLQFMSDHADSRTPEEKEKSTEDTVNSLASIYVISLDATDDEEGMEIEDTNSPDIEKNAEFRQIRGHMREAIDTLPEVEKRLVKMYYFQNRTLEEVGEELNLSKSWTSRLHARALELLLKRIKQRTHNPKMGGGR